MAQPQARCQPPAIVAAVRQPNIFTPQQEMDLGDAIAEHAQRDYHVIDDDEIAGYLRRVGARLVQQLPASELRYQFFLVDLPDVNAFALPGGRVYVTRKLIAFARTEDELAGVLAHELGHIVTRQTSADMTRLFREVLKVEQVTDRRDIFAKYNQLLENTARKPGAWRRGDKHEEQQYEADQVALYAMAAAGYDPQAFATFWDRLTEVQGRTGSWLSDFFGTTKPEARRLREIIKGLGALPAACRVARPEGPAAEFPQWQVGEGQVTQRGRYVIESQPARRGGSLDKNVTLTVSDTRTGATLWTRAFPQEAPHIFVEENEGTMVLLWAVKTEQAKTELEGNPALSQQVAALKEKEGDYFLQTLDARTGQVTGALLIETGKGSFRIADTYTVGDWVIVADTSNRVLVYARTGGAQRGTFFGRLPVVSKTSNLLSVENEPGQLTVYDLTTASKRAQFNFASPVALTQFSTDGKQLFVLTANQTAYVLRPGAEQAAQ